MPESETPEVFAVETHRFEINPGADLLAQIVNLGWRIIEMERSHTSGARVCAVIVEMERPINQEGE